MGIVLVPEKIARCFPLSVLIAVRRLPYRLNPVGTDQFIAGIVTRHGVIATRIDQEYIPHAIKEGLRPLFFIDYFAVKSSKFIL